MYRSQTLQSLVVCGGIFAAAAAAGCSRGEEPTAVADTQTTSAQPANQPITISGCLKAGEAADTFVLTAAKSAGSQDTATYQLVGGTGVMLQEHIGQRVEVSGTMRSQQEIASRTTAVPDSDDRPTGTSGAPKVETRTEIDIKQVSVGSVKALADDCGM